MKMLSLLLLSMTISASSFATVPTSLKTEYATQAKLAAAAIHNLNWGVSKTDNFKIIKASITEDSVNITGTFKIRVFTKQNGNDTDKGIDLDVYIFDGAVLKVTVDCRICA